MNPLGERVHLVGMGGEGMSGLAMLMLEAGAQVSGTDLKRGGRLGQLARRGAEVHVGHAAEHVPEDAQALIYSSVIPGTNPEVRAAQRRGVTLWPRLTALGAMIEARYSVGVVGTHGKTTVASWLTHVLRSVVGPVGHYVGGDVPGMASASLGRDPLFVAEIDESDGRFASLDVELALLTTLDADHLEAYGGWYALCAAFSAFIARSNRAVVCLDDPNVARLRPPRRDWLTYGLRSDAHVRASDVEHRGGRSTFRVHARGHRPVDLQLPAPGIHNVRNALGVIGVGLLLDLPLRDMASALVSAPGPRRRLEVLNDNGCLLVDDYAHHPREVGAGLAALRSGWPGRRVLAVFQPHRYTRTARFVKEFGVALAAADHVVVTEIYPAGEAPVARVSGIGVAEAVRRQGGRAEFRPTLEEAREALATARRPGDLIVCFGAGDIWQLSHRTSQELYEGG